MVWRYARGSIPACAGETVGGKRRVAPEVVYPRVCGGNRAIRRARCRAVGLSPRVRGKPPRLSCLRPSGGSIPACAGETGNGRAESARNTVYPRVCGGNLSGSVENADIAGLSPRVRGKRHPLTLSRPRPRSIPACAGETTRMSLISWGKMVYPRVCGGNGSHRRRPPAAWGLSPRVRGKLRRGPRGSERARSIPACAGETAASCAAPAT